MYIWTKMHRKRRGTVPSVGQEENDGFTMGSNNRLSSFAEEDIKFFGSHKKVSKK